MRQAVIFDFGGVIAEEGFQEGLGAIARAHGLDEAIFFERARELIYQTGYVTGTSNEHTYWQAIREEFGISESDRNLREQVLNRFVVRSEMLSFTSDLSKCGHITALLTDQTDWLYHLDRQDGLRILAPFQFVFNSYDLHMSKRDPALFHHVEQTLRVAPKDILFADDNPDNVRLALRLGWRAVLFGDYQTLKENLSAEALMAKVFDP